MSYFYVDPDAESDPHKLPDVEVWYTQKNYKQRGYYYAYGFPGCLHDSEPIGPFKTQDEALENAREDTLMDNVKLEYSGKITMEFNNKEGTISLEHGAQYTGGEFVKATCKKDKLTKMLSPELIEEARQRCQQFLDLTGGTNA